MKTLLIIVSIIGLSAVVGAIVVGRSTFDGIVVDKPYERGLAYDAVQKEREEAGWNVDISIPSPAVGLNELVIATKDRNGKPLSDATVALTIGRPSSANHDRNYTAVRAEGGQFKAIIELPLHGYWDVKVSVTAEGRTILFENKIFAAQGGNR